VLEVAGILLFVTPAAYAFSRFQFKGKHLTLLGILLFQMISPVVIVIPLYNMMVEFGLMNTHIGLIALYIGLQMPFSIWLLKATSTRSRRNSTSRLVSTGATASRRSGTSCYRR